MIFENYEFRNINLSTVESLSDFQKIIWAVEKARHLQSTSKNLLKNINIFDENTKFMNICSEFKNSIFSLAARLNFQNKLFGWMVIQLSRCTLIRLGF